MKKLINLLLIGILFLNLSCAENNVSVKDKLKEDNWVWSVYNDVLNSQSRDTYYKYAPYYLEEPYADPELSDEVFFWYEKGWGFKDFPQKRKESLQVIFSAAYEL